MATPLPTDARAKHALAAGLALVCLTSLAYFVHPWYDPTNDGSMYVATARAIASGEGYSYLGEPFRIRPPGFSLLLAPIFALAGTSFTAINVLVSVFGVLLVVGLFYFCEPRLGKGLAFLVALSVWLNPGVQRLCNQVMSDVPGVALVLLVLLAERKRRGRELLAEGGWKRELLLGLGLGLVVHVRSSALLVLPAILVARALGRLGAFREGKGVEPLGRWLAANALVVLGAAAVIAPWSARNALVAPEPPADQTRLYDYGTGMWHEDMGDPGSRRLSVGEVLGRFDQRRVQITASLGSRLTRPEDKEAGAENAVWTVFFVLCSLMVLVRRREPAELFVFATLAVVSVYFGYSPRLMLPCYVLGLAAGAEVVRGLGRILLPHRVADAITALALVALTAWDFGPRRGWERIREVHEAFESVAAEIDRRVPEAVLGAYRGWHFSVFLDRPVYSFEQVQRRSGRPKACEELIDRYGVEVVILVPMALPYTILQEHTRLETYLENRYGRAAGPLKLVRVRE